MNDTDQRVCGRGRRRIDSSVGENASVFPLNTPYIVGGRLKETGSLLEVPSGSHKFGRDTQWNVSCQSGLWFR